MGSIKFVILYLEYVVRWSILGVLQVESYNFKLVLIKKESLQKHIWF